MRPSPVICWLASRVTGDWLGQKEGEKKGGQEGVTWGALPSGIKPLFFITAGEAAVGGEDTQRGNKSISTPVFHHQGCYQLDSEPNHAAVQRSRMQAGVAQSQCVVPVRRVNKRGNLYSSF